MKKLKLFGILSMMLWANQYLIADSIVKKNGEVIQCSNVEVTDKYVLYTKEGDTSLYKISTEEVFGVQIGDNPMVSLSELKSDKGSNNQKERDDVRDKVDDNLPKYVEPMPSADNKRLIELYNNQTISRKGKKPNGKISQWFYALWAITNNSILADENVEIAFERQIGIYEYIIYPSDCCCYKIKITNKTRQPIYVDLANSFKVKYNGEAVAYFTNSTYSTSSGKSSGASMNLGAIAGAVGIGGVVGTLASGISVGGGKSGESQITTTEQQVLVIPAYSSAYLPGTKELSGNQIEEIQDSFCFVNQYKKDEFAFTFEDLRSKEEDIPGNVTDLNIRQWETTEFDYEQSPKRVKRIVTYSTRQDFATYTSLPIELYLSSAFGFVRNQKVDGLKHYDFTDLSHAIFGLGYAKKK